MTLLLHTIICTELKAVVGNTGQLAVRFMEPPLQFDEKANWECHEGYILHLGISCSFRTAKKLILRPCAVLPRLGV